MGWFAMPGVWCGADARDRLIGSGTRPTPSIGAPAFALPVPHLAVRPQLPIHARGRFLGRPDLVDESLGIVLEADSFEWHGSRAALRSDARRYNAFVVNGWLVLRFAWEDVMFHADEVRRVLVAAVEERTNARCAACRGAS